MTHAWMRGPLTGEAAAGQVKESEVLVKFSKKNFTTKYADISGHFVNLVKLVKFFWNSYGFLKI